MIEIFTKAMQDAGFSGKIASNTIHVLYDTPPLSIPFDREDKYHDAVRAVPGVVFDDGQSNGYQFEVEIDNFTRASERKLLKVLARYKRYAINAGSAAAADGQETKTIEGKSR